MAVNDVVQIRFITKLDDQISINVVNFKVTAEATGGATMQEIANLMSSRGQSIYPDVMTASGEYRGAQAQKVFPLPKGATFSSSDPAAGTRSTEPLPPQTCGVISLKTALAGRHFRGRIYLPFPAENDNGVTHIPSVTYLANANTLMTSIFVTTVVVGAAGSTTMKPVIFNRATGGTTDVTSGRVREGWGTQRRRSYFGQHNLPPV